MQRILNLSILFILAVLFSAPVSAQSGNYNSDSADILSETANATDIFCPFEMANGLTCTSVSYNPVLKELVYTMDTDPTLFPYDIVIANINSSKTGVIDTFYGSPDTKILLDALMDSSASLVYNYQYPDGRHIKLTITADDIRKAGSRTQADVVSTALYNLNQMIKADTYPIKMDEITMLDEVFIKGDKLCFRYSITSPIQRPSGAAVSNLRNNLEQNMLTNATARALASNAINAGLTVEHTYTCSSWSSPFTVSFTPAQLKTLLGI